MRSVWLPISWCLLWPLTGCALLREGTDLVAFKLGQCVSEKREWQRNTKLAEEALGQHCGANPVSVDFATGFKEGYSIHLYQGECEAPTLPPHRYRTLKYQTPAGFQAIEEWYAGYRAGIDSARASGYRRFVLGPVYAQETSQPTMSPVPGTFVSPPQVGQVQGPSGVGSWPGQPMPVPPMPAASIPPTPVQTPRASEQTRPVDEPPLAEPPVPRRATEPAPEPAKPTKPPEPTSTNPQRGAHEQARPDPLPLLNLRPGTGPQLGTRIEAAPVGPKLGQPDAPGWIALQQLPGFSTEK